MYREALMRHSDGLELVTCPHRRLGALLDVAHSAAWEVREVVYATPDSGPRRLADAAMRTFRYLSVGRAADAQRLRAALPELAKFWKGPGDGNAGVLQCYRQAMEEAHLLDETELNRGHLPACIKQARRDHLRRHHQTIRRRRHRVLPQSWYIVDGTPLVGLDSIGDEFHKHWNHALREGPCSSSAADVFVRYAQDSGMRPTGLGREP